MYMEGLKQVAESIEVSDKPKKVYFIQYPEVQENLSLSLGQFKFKFSLKKMGKENYVSEFLNQFPKESFRNKKDLETSTSSSVIIS